MELWYPEKKLQQILWTIAHESSVFPAVGTKLLKKMVREGKIEVYLITARYSFLDDHLNKWLRRKKLRDIFTSINLNKNDEQPHLFKERIIKKHSLDFFIEDNLDIVKHLESSVPCKIFWIYNILDRNTEYKYKFPYLKAALQKIK